MSQDKRFDGPLSEDNEVPYSNFTGEDEALLARLPRELRELILAIVRKFPVDPDVKKAAISKEPCAHIHELTVQACLAPILSKLGKVMPITEG